LDAFCRLRQVAGKPDLRLVLLDVGNRHDWKDPSILSQWQYWRSHTPYVPPRHEKTRGRNRETPLEQLHGELQQRGFPAPVVVKPIPRCELDGRSIRWIEFRRERLFGGGSRGQGLGYGFAIEFPKPVCGPICLGYACHFGMGLFLPVMT
jgi:CRISPR-associated protein Csb2